MSFFSKLMFWKKSDELGLDNLGLDQGAGASAYPGQGNAYPGQGNYGSYPQEPVQPQQSWSQPVQPGGIGSPYQQQFQPQAPQMDPFQSSGYAAGKQLEVVSAKLDALKAAIDSLNQRMANVERMMQGEDYFRKKGW